MSLKTLVDRHRVTSAVLQPIGVELEVLEARISLDEARAPYARVDIECKLPDDVDRQLVNLTGEDSIRLELRARREFGGGFSLAAVTAAIGGGSMAAMTTLMDGNPLSALTNLFYEPWNGALVLPHVSRQFDLWVDERVFVDKSDRMSIVAKTDDQRLINDSLVATEPLDPGSTDLAQIVSWVLERYDAALVTADTATVSEPDATLWQPGVPAWDYLDPMLEAASLRLWCDELGRFHLGPRQAEAEGSVTIVTSSAESAGNMVDNRDRMTYDPSVWYEAVVIEYRWVDELLGNQVEWDVAGVEPSRSTLYLRRQGVIYPGPGAAAGILTRAAGRGRVLDTVALSDYSVTPGMSITITPPDTLAQSGFIAGVEWSIPAGEMTLRTRGLVETPTDSFLAGPEDVTFATVAVDAPTLAIEDFDWSLV